MSTEQIRRWESGALAHGVTDPVRPGPAALAARQRALPGRHRPGRPLVRGPGRGTRAGGPGSRSARPDAAGSGPRTADDVRRQIKGVRLRRRRRARRAAIDFHVTVDPPQQFTVDVYRIGHYGGDGAAHDHHQPPALRHRPAGRRSPPGRTVSCHHWWLSWRLQIPSYWSHRRLRRRAHHRRRLPQPHPVHRPRPPRPADLLLLLPDVTWQAYNLYPEDGRTGASLYHAWDERGPAARRGGGRHHGLLRPPLRRRRAAAARRPRLRLHPLGRALRLRPRLRRRPRPARRPGRPHPLPRRWSSPATTSTGRRRCAGPSRRARDSGTSLVFLSANTMYWQVELAASPSGDPDRLLTCRKRRGDPRQPHRAVARPRPSRSSC